jgi:DNA-directed RNA polymerase specialized sigma subunit
MKQTCYQVLLDMGFTEDELSSGMLAELWQTADNYQGEGVSWYALDATIDEMIATLRKTQVTLRKIQKRLAKENGS